MHKFFILSHLKETFGNHDECNKQVLLKSSLQRALSDLGFKIDLSNTPPIVGEVHQELLDSIIEYVEVNLDPLMSHTKADVIELGPYYYKVIFYK